MRGRTWWGSWGNPVVLRGTGHPRGAVPVPDGTVFCQPWARQLPSPYQDAGQPWVETGQGHERSVAGVRGRQACTSPGGSCAPTHPLDGVCPEPVEGAGQAPGGSVEWQQVGVGQNVGLDGAFGPIRLFGCEMPAHSLAIAAIARVAPASAAVSAGIHEQPATTGSSTHPHAIDPRRCEELRGRRRHAPEHAVHRSPTIPAPVVLSAPAVNEALVRARFGYSAVEEGKVVIGRRAPLHRSHHNPMDRLPKRPSTSQHLVRGNLRLGLTVSIQVDGCQHAGLAAPLHQIPHGREVVHGAIGAAPGDGVHEIEAALATTQRELSCSVGFPCGHRLTFRQRRQQTHP